MRGWLAIAAIVCGGAQAADLDPEQFTVEAKAALVRAYKDPASAQFRDTYVIRWDDKGREVYSLCGEVNAKNSYGAYIGFTAFYVDLLPSGKLSPSSDLVPAVGQAAVAKFAVEHCNGQRRPVARVK